MTKELKKLMKKNDFTLIRQKKHLVWEHTTGGLVTTSSTPSCKNALRNIMKDIKTVTGACYA
jgi:predicted RNA binding protein YcfA (HicA-like mRNA interferase family)